MPFLPTFPDVTEGMLSNLSRRMTERKKIVVPRFSPPRVVRPVLPKPVRLVNLCKPLVLPAPVPMNLVLWTDEPARCGVVTLAGPSHPIIVSSSDMDSEGVALEPPEKVSPASGLPVPVPRPEAAPRPPPQKVRIMDITGAVTETLAEPHPDVQTADQLLAAAQERGFVGPLPEQDAMKPRQGPRGVPLGNISQAATQNMDQVMALVLGKAPTSLTAAEASTLVNQMQAQMELQANLHADQINRLRAYEVQAKQALMENSKLKKDLEIMEQLLLDKDMQLAQGFEVLAASASERARLRVSYQTAVKRAGDLASQLAIKESEVEAARKGLLKAGDGNSPRGLLPAPSGGDDDDDDDDYDDEYEAPAPRATDAPELAAAKLGLSDLSDLAASMAAEMKAELRAINGRSMPYV